jgi:hypothetical protein
MTIKRGLKRIWILVSVLWVAFGLAMVIADKEPDLSMIFWGITGGLATWWAIWWTIYWIISGFFSDEDKRDEDKLDY